MVILCKLSQIPAHTHIHTHTHTSYSPPTAVNYKQAVESAFLEVQDILGSLGLGDDDGLHGNNQSIQEVEVSYQGDGDSLESPPDSEKDPFEELDPLLDFGLDDDLTINKGSESSGADLMRSTIEVQRALKVSDKLISTRREVV